MSRVRLKLSGVNGLISGVEIPTSEEDLRKDFDFDGDADAILFLIWSGIWADTFNVLVRRLGLTPQQRDNLTAEASAAKHRVMERIQRGGVTESGAGTMDDDGRGGAPLGHRAVDVE